MLLAVVSVLAFCAVTVLLVLGNRLPAWRAVVYVSPLVLLPVAASNSYSSWGAGCPAEATDCDLTVLASLAMGGYTFLGLLITVVVVEAMIRRKRDSVQTR